MSFNFSPKITTDGLILYLDAANTKSYPGSGTDWTDLSKGGNNGTLTNGPIFNSSNGGNIVFDGIDDCITILNNSDLNFSNNLSINCWVNPTSFLSNYLGIVDKYIGSTSGYYIDIFNATKLVQFGIHIGGLGNERTATSTTALSAGKWHMITCTYDGSNVKIYFNGVNEQSTPATGNITANAQNIFIGGDGVSTNYFNGKIAQFSMYNRALTKLEITQNFNVTKTRFGL